MKLGFNKLYQICVISKKIDVNVNIIRNIKRTNNFYQKEFYKG